jgi:hypothetical protein
MRSHWREFQFALHQLQQSIAPRLGLPQVLEHCNEIAASQAEHNRERAPQLKCLSLS